jgi:hypothetical protein
VQAAIPRAQPADFVTDGLIGESVDAQANANASNQANPAIVELVLPKPPDTAIGPVSPGISGSDRPVTISIGFAVPEVLLAPAWGAQIKPLTRELTSAGPGARGALRDLARRNRGALPAPQGADLITNLAALGQVPFAESLQRMIGASGGSSEESPEHHGLNHAHLVLIALAVAALEAARRWRGRQTQASARSRRWRNSLLMGLPRTFR